MKQELINTIAAFLNTQEMQGEDLGSLENLLLSSYLKIAQGNEEVPLFLASFEGEFLQPRLVTWGKSDDVAYLKEVIMEEIEEDGSL